MDIPVCLQLKTKTTSTFDPCRTLTGSVSVYAQVGLGKPTGLLETVSQPATGNQHTAKDHNDLQHSTLQEKRLLAIKRGPKPKDANSINFIETKPNSNGAVLRRLARDAPEMLDKIEAGVLSVNAAAIQAGITHAPAREVQDQRLLREGS